MKEKNVIRVAKYELIEPVTLYIVNEFTGPTIVKLEPGDTLSYNFTNYTIDKNGKSVDDNVVYSLPVKPLPELKVTVRVDYNKKTMNIYAHDWQGFTNEEIIEAFKKSLNNIRI